MVKEKSPETADRPQGLLNRRYRRYLLGESDIEPRTQAERDIRMNIRQRLYNGLLDFILVYQYIEQRDIDMALSKLEGDDRLHRDKAIANAMALFFDLGSGEELADASEFERYVERAAILSWHDRYDTAEGVDIWLGEPNAEVTVEFPDRIDLDDLLTKTAIIWDRIHEKSEFLVGDIGDPSPDKELGERLGLNSLSTDEVLFLISHTVLIEEGDKFGVPTKHGKKLEMMAEVARLWVLWKQQTRQNLPDSTLEVLTNLRRFEESSEFDSLDELSDNGEGGEP